MFEYMCVCIRVRVSVSLLYLFLELLQAEDATAVLRSVSLPLLPRRIEEDGLPPQPVEHVRQALFLERVRHLIHRVVLNV